MLGWFKKKFGKKPAEPEVVAPEPIPDAAEEVLIEAPLAAQAPATQVGRGPHVLSQHHPAVPAAVLQLLPGAGAAQRWASAGLTPVQEAAGATVPLLVLHAMLRVWVPAAQGARLCWAAFLACCQRPTRLRP